MELELAITSYQRLSPTVISSMQFTTASRYVLGRSKDCHWYLPDPDRVISSRHAEIFSRDGRFWLKDISTNGVFLNGTVEPLGSRGEVALSQGDTLRFGDYELTVTRMASGSDATLADLPEEPSVSHTASASAAVSTPTPRPPRPTATSLGDRPVPEAMGGNPTLASGLSEQRLGDSHVEIPDVAIPPVWKWGETTEQGQSQTPAPRAEPDQLAALFNGLGMPHLANQAVSSAQLQNLGDLTRILLERLLDLLHARAEQKQKLRVQQTLFQRSENNPLKFSATAQDAIEALLVRRHSSFQGPREAVEEAFNDILEHERALMAGVDKVISEILHSSAGEAGLSGLGKWSVLRKARAYDALMQQRALQTDEFGDSTRMLRSDTFVEAYEAAARVRE